MAYVHDTHTIVAQPANQGEKPGYIAALQAARGLVHQYYSSVRRDSATDLDDLTKCDRQAAHASIWANLGMIEIARQAERSIAAGFKVHQSHSRRLYAHHYVFSYTKMWKERQLLVD